MDERLPLPGPVRSDRDAIGRCPVARAELEGVLGRLQRETQDEGPVRERLLAMPTRLRASVAAALALLLGGVVLGGLGLRPDLGDGSPLAEAGLLAGLALLVGVATAVGLRGVHQRPLGRRGWLVASAALLAPTVLGLVPDVFGPGPAGPPGASNLGLGCLCLGLAAAGAVGVAAGLFQRADRPAGWRLGAIAGAGGLVAFVVTQLHCPSPDLLHRVVGHGSAGLLLFALLLATRRRSR